MNAMLILQYLRAIVMVKLMVNSLTNRSVMPLRRRWGRPASRCRSSALSSLPSSMSSMIVIRRAQYRRSRLLLKAHIVLTLR